MAGFFFENLLIQPGDAGALPEGFKLDLDPSEDEESESLELESSSDILGLGIGTD